MEMGMAVKWAPSPLSDIAFRASGLLDSSAVFPMLHANHWTGIQLFISFQTSRAGNDANNCFVVAKAS